MNRILAFLFAVLTFPLMAANPSFQDFQSSQFGTTGNKVVVKNGALVTNTVIQGTTTIGGRLIATNTAAGGGTNYIRGTLVVGTNSLVVTTNGNVGIGTWSPISKLSVDANLTTNGGISSVFQASGSNPNIRGIFLHGGNGLGYLDAGGLQIISQGANNSVNGSGNIQFMTTSGNSANGSTDATLVQRMTILYDGKVGIGVTAPASVLHVAGVVAARTSTLTDGYVSMSPSDAFGSGYLSWWKAGNTRLGYMGYSPDDIVLTLENGADFSVMDGNILANSAIYATGNVVSVSGIYYGNASGVSNAVDVIAGSGVTVATNGPRSFTISAVPSTSLWFTNPAAASSISNAYNVGIVGSLGVGTVSPITKFSVDANIATNGGIASVFQASGSSPNIRGIFLHGGNGSGYLGAGGLQIIAQGAQNAANGSGDINFFTTGVNSANGSTDASVLERMTIRYDGSVGIGTAVPLNKLGVSGNGVFGSSYAGIVSAPTDGLLVQGNVGIGTANPGSTLSILNSVAGGTIGTAFQQELVNNHVSSGDWTGTIFRWSPNSVSGNQAYIGALITSGAANTVSDLIFGVKDSTATTDISEAVRIRAGGNVGIGTASPASKLDVAGTVLAKAFSTRTNAFSMSPNLADSGQLGTTNASFKFLQCINVDTTKTKYEWTELFMDNSSGSPIVATPPDNVTGICQPWYITNRSKFRVEVYGGDKFTNMYHVALR